MHDRVLMIDELLDLVDSNDAVVGCALRSEVYADKLNNFRVVNVLIENTAGQLWIPRRSSTKRIYPLSLDTSMGGHVMHGETYDQSLARELKEELNIDISGVTCQFLGHLTPHQHDVSAFMQVYKIAQDTVPDYNREDFVEYYWLSPRELSARLKCGDTAKSDLPKIVNYFLGI